MHGRLDASVSSRSARCRGAMCSRACARGSRAFIASPTRSRRLSPPICCSRSARIPSMTIAPEEIARFVGARRRAAGQSRHVRSRTPRGDRDRDCEQAAEQRGPGCSIRCSIDRSPRARRLCPQRWSAQARGGAPQCARNSRRSPERRRARRGAAALCADDRASIVALTGATDYRHRRRASSSRSPTAIR